jgi:WXG100 family type VII secretion target
MPLTVSEVLGARPEGLLRAATELQSAASQVDSQLAAERGRLANLAADWTGPSSDAAQDHAEELLGDQVGYRNKLTAMQKELATAGDDLGHYRSALSSLVNSPEAQYFDIADDGTVSLGLRLQFMAAMSPALAMKFGLRRLALQTAIQTALAHFQSSDTAAAAALRKIDGS